MLGIGRFDGGFDGRFETRFERVFQNASGGALENYSLWRRFEVRFGDRFEHHRAIGLAAGLQNFSVDSL